MIASLNVQNIALIDELQIDFTDGLNVLSGETGAGKSVLLNAVNLILGERAERTLIRHGESRARVEAVIYPDEATAARVRNLGIPCEEEMVVTRVLTSGGKSVSRINGRAVTLSTLRSVMRHLVDLHGQHEHQSLLDSAYHTSVLDTMSGKAALELNKSIVREWKALQALNKEQASLGGEPKERAYQIELLQYQLDEVRSAAVKGGELDALERERRRFENIDDMKHALYVGGQLLKDDEGESRSVLSGLRSIADTIKRYADLDERLPQILQTCEDAYYSMEDISYTLVDIVDSLETDEARLASVNQRIAQIRGMLRKYDASDENALNAMTDEWEQQLHALENADQRAAELGTFISARKDALAALYAQLSACRQATAEQLSAQLSQQLDELGMNGAAFEVRFSGLDDTESIRFGSVSPETAEFFLSVNPGEPLRPLSRIASGGEISRIMLAFKVIMAEHDEIDTLVFDEIDTGISGRTAQVVGEKMAQVALSRQIIAVTHLPQIAVMADQNFYIHKEAVENRTVTHIDALNSDGVRAEMVRLTGGMESRNAEAHADELMSQAAKIKKQLRGQAV